ITILPVLGQGVDVDAAQQHLAPLGVDDTPAAFGIGLGVQVRQAQQRRRRGGGGARTRRGGAGGSDGRRRRRAGGGGGRRAGGGGDGGGRRRRGRRRGRCPRGVVAAAGGEGEGEGEGEGRAARHQWGSTTAERECQRAAPRAPL